MSPVFRHGGLRLYLLKLLDEAPRHGYDVIRLLQDRFLGVYSPSPGTIYPRLARLEEEGLVTHEVVDGKKVYRITDAGREELNRRFDDLADLEDELVRLGARHRQGADQGRQGDRAEPARRVHVGGPRGRAHRTTRRSSQITPPDDPGGNGGSQTRPDAGRRRPGQTASTSHTPAAAAPGAHRGSSGAQRPTRTGRDGPPTRAPGAPRRSGPTRTIPSAVRPTEARAPTEAPGTDPASAGAGENDSDRPARRDRLEGGQAEAVNTDRATPRPAGGAWATSTAEAESAQAEGVGADAAGPRTPVDRGPRGAPQAMATEQALPTPQAQAQVQAQTPSRDSSAEGGGARRRVGRARRLAGVDRLGQARAWRDWAGKPDWKDRAKACCTDWSGASPVRLDPVRPPRLDQRRRPQESGPGPQGPPRPRPRPGLRPRTPGRRLRPRDPRRSPPGRKRRRRRGRQPRPHPRRRPEPHQNRSLQTPTPHPRKPHPQRRRHPGHRPRKRRHPGRRSGRQPARTTEAPPG